MATTTLTMAGLQAHAGVARLGAVSGVARSTAPLAATAGVLATQGVYGHHQSASWTVGAIAKPATFMVFDRKNRPTRPLSELSP